MSPSAAQEVALTPCLFAQAPPRHPMLSLPGSDSLVLECVRAIRRFMGASMRNFHLVLHNLDTLSGSLVEMHPGWADVQMHFTSEHSKTLSTVTDSIRCAFRN